MCESRINALPYPFESKAAMGYLLILSGYLDPYPASFGAEGRGVAVRSGVGDVKQVGSFERESSAGVERALSRCAIVVSRCINVWVIAVTNLKRGARSCLKKIARALCAKGKLLRFFEASANFRPSCCSVPWPRCSARSAQMAQRSENVRGTGHGRGRPQKLLSPFGATAPAPASGMMVTGTICS